MRLTGVLLCSGLLRHSQGLPVWSKYSNAQRVSIVHVYRHHERNHPGKENLLLFPTSNQLPQSERKVRSRERLGKLLHFYHREAA